MNKEKIKEILTREPTQSELYKLVEMARTEIKEWTNFIRICKEKQK